MLADLARRDGRQVLAFDLFGDLDLRRGASRVVTGDGLTALVDAAVAEPPSGVVYGASFENHPALVARLAERHTLLGNTPETLRAVRDPATARRGAASRTRGRPSTRRASDPAAGCASRCAAAAAYACATGAAARCRPGTYVQERIDGLACSAAAVGDGRDAVVLGLTEQLVGRARVRRPRLPLVREHRAAAAAARGLREQARAICSRLAGAFALRGLFGVDFIWDGERAWTHEVNPRPTASLEAIEAAYGIDVFDAHLRGCAGELPAIEAARAGAAGKAVVFATEDVVIGDSERWLERGVRDVPHPGEQIAAGRPICTVVRPTAPRSPWRTSSSGPRGCARTSRVEVAARG